MDDYIKYSSTRGGDDSLSYEEVLLAGLARDGGLFMPEKWPSFSHVDLKNMKELSYSKLASKILKPFIQLICNILGTLPGTYNLGNLVITKLKCLI